VIQGFGNVGSFAARFLHEAGGRVIAVSDVKGGIFNPEGLDVPALLRHVATHGGLTGFPGVDRITNAELLTTECDVLIPAALGGVITADNAAALRTGLVVEAANGPTDPDGDRILRQREIPVFPDILANAGGVVVSYFEWVQNIQQFSWNEQRVNSELETIMLKAYRKVREVALRRKVALRTAAFLIGIGRVGRAKTLRGI
jgi:glutamate dehydrogenase (NAD(P)+)